MRCSLFLSDMSFVIGLYQSVLYFFYFLDSVFCRVEFFHFTFFFSFFEFPILRKSSLPIFSLIVYAFGVVAEKPSPKQGLSCFLLYYFFKFYQCSSVTQLCSILCDPMNFLTPGFHVYHQLL